MAKKRKSTRRITNNSLGRDARAIASRRAVLKKRIIQSNTLRYHDDRRFHPEPSILRRKALLTGALTHAVYKPVDRRRGQQKASSNRLHQSLAFSPTLPLKKAVTCARRTIRKQVLFAKGKGGGRHKKPTFNSNSNIRCK